MLALDDETTWPAELRHLLDDGLETLSAFEVERDQIDRLCEVDIAARAHPPQNRCEVGRDRLLAAVNDLLIATELVGYHCTRLHEAEIESIRARGLQPLDAELARRRVRGLVAAGEMQPSIADRLLADNRTDDRSLPARRTGMVWFIFSEATLGRERAVWRFFHFWGGEALYLDHEADPEIAPLLRAIGSACIVEARVPVRSIETSCTVGERLVRAFLHRRGVQTGHDPLMEGHTKGCLGGAYIRRIVRRQDPDFERLTTCSTWFESPT